MWSYRPFTTVELIIVIFKHLLWEYLLCHVPFVGHMWYAPASAETRVLVATWILNDSSGVAKIELVAKRHRTETIVRTLKRTLNSKNNNNAIEMGFAPIHQKCEHIFI